MASVASGGTADRIAARILFRVLRAGSGTPARYSSISFTGWLRSPEFAFFIAICTPGCRLKAGCGHDWPPHKKALDASQGFRELRDLPHLFGAEAEVRGADHAFHLLGRAHADDGGRHRGMAEGPGDGDFARRAAVALADGAEQFGQLQIAREAR